QQQRSVTKPRKELAHEALRDAARRVVPPSRSGCEVDGGRHHKRVRSMSTRFTRITGILVGVVSALVTTTIVHGQLPGIRETDDQIKYARGQNVVPVYEGWVPNPDGTFSLVFGTWNRNWEETVIVPVGPDNHIDPGGPDRGQPTVFGPRRGKNVFEI